MGSEDRYAGLGYRRMIQWSSRLEREWPLFEEFFSDVPRRRLLDLGCGPGEHCARFAAAGWETVGVDVSAQQIADAREHHPELEFVQADLAELEAKVGTGFGAAMCIGNVLPNLDDAAFHAMLRGLAGSVESGGRILLQQLEFGPILDGRRRSIGPIFTGDPREGTESAFLRIFCPTEDPRVVRFLPTRLRLAPEEDPPVELDRVESITWRARRREDVEAALGQHGFEIIEVFGAVDRSPHDPESSSDLWVLASR